MKSDFQKNLALTVENSKIHGEPQIFLKNALQNLANDSQIALLEKFAQGILKWNAVYQLTAAKNLESLLPHIVDCAAAAPFLENAQKILDVGSGAGLPGIVLAILKPESHFTLVDSIQKKTAFLNDICRVLNLKNVEIVNNRVEKMRGEFDKIICRAFANLADFVKLTAHLLAENGAWLAMKGANFKDEIALLPHNIHTQIVALKIPEVAGARHLCILGRKQ